ncbi:MAG: cytochrome c biogenesis protein CcsA [Candidatus Tectomicrobia bacterium]|uniref:Heme exporter protein C n=1 Tax=Tectimicrobiota bacterium TaxID=2528274 RepID=A0A932I0R8_UNCTE|nr:cytochrome c biogenesis protein CcsA [Candidatus Tectomicrobia bacterium]
MILAAKDEGRDRWLGLAAAALLVFGIYAGLFIAGTDRFQGPPQRIFYVHVPAAWIAFFAFFLVFIFSVRYLAWRGENDDIRAHACAEVGVLFATLVLITGPIWARPIWGVWWTWDPRLTTSLILWLIYVGYLMLRAYMTDPDQRARFAAVLGIAGFINVPITHLSVVWWRTLHPGPVVLRRGGMGELPATMHVALWSCLLAFTLLFIYFVRKRTAIERLQARAEAAHAGAGG